MHNMVCRNKLAFDMGYRTIWHYRSLLSCIVSRFSLPYLVLSSASSSPILRASVYEHELPFALVGKDLRSSNSENFSRRK
jgi:hypothetical protein